MNQKEIQIMAHQKIEPHRVTKPIQLLAAWLIGMIVVESLLLTAANLGVVKK